MKKPEECENMLEIRTAIDNIDQEIIALIGKRYQYVKSAAKFKTSETSVKAPERFAALLIQRRAWAAKQGLSEDMIAKLYTDMVNYFIQEELSLWKKH
ncbi:isochorismate lyase [Mucilaginibacter sp. HD30]